MDENIVKYANKEVNVFTTGNFKTTREIAPNGLEYIQEYIIDGEEELLFRCFWYNPNRKVVKDKTKSKNTGGKKPYLMLMTNEIEELRGKGVKNVEELIGYTVSLGKYVEWNTGKLINNRSKKTLQYKDLISLYKCSKPKLNKMLKLMKDNDLLYHTDEGYFISSKYIKKGNTKGVIENDQ